MHGLKAREFKAADQMIGSISCRLEMEDMLEHPAGLSSGQKQRVALERAVVRNPPVPLLYTVSPTWPTAPGSPWASGRRCGIASDSAKGITITWPISSTARVRLGDQHGRQAWRRHRGADCRRRKLRARAAGGRDGAAGARLPLRRRFGGTLR